MNVKLRKKKRKDFKEGFLGFFAPCQDLGKIPSEDDLDALINPLIEQIDKIKLSRLMGRYRAKVGEIIKFYRPAFMSEDATIGIKMQFVKILNKRMS